MTDDDRLARLLRSTLRPMPVSPLTRDLWPLVLGRRQARARWPWLDLGLALAVVIALLLFPEWLRLVVYHL